MRARAFAVGIVALGLVSVASAEQPPEPQPSADYPLDPLPRAIAADQRRIRCDTSELVYYRGTLFRFAVPARMHVAFVPIVQRFEALVREVAIAHYGRAPRRMSHAGSYNCRRIRGSTDSLSEHAFGNALDVRGFDFYRARESEPLPAGAPESLRRSFRVRVEDHWAADAGVDAYHAAFFVALRERLESEDDLFHVMLGPSFPGHRNHLHLDRSPSRYVQF